MHALSQPAISSPCDLLHCSHLCLLAPAARGRFGVQGSAGAPAVRGPSAVCRCPKGLLLSKDKITCSLPLESTFILLLSRTTVYQVNCLIVVSRTESGDTLLRNQFDTLSSTFCLNLNKTVMFCCPFTLFIFSSHFL